MRSTILNFDSAIFRFFYLPTSVKLSTLTISKINVMLMINVGIKANQLSVFHLKKLMLMINTKIAVDLVFSTPNIYTLPFKWYPTR